MKSYHHVLYNAKTCPCDCYSDASCNICDGGLAVCAACGKAEVELSQPCSMDRLLCAECGDEARTYYDPEFYDVNEGAYITDCGTGGCPHEAAGTLMESRDNYQARRTRKVDE